MILLTITIEENKQMLKSKGVLSAVKPSEMEEEMANDLLKAIEDYCVKRSPDGAMFIRHELPSKKKPSKKKS